MNNFIRRTLTGAGIVLFILAGFWLHPVSFFMAGLILLVGVQYEYYNIITLSGIPTRTIEGIITGVAIYTIATLVSSGIADPRLFLTMIPLMMLIIIAELYRNESRPFDILAHTFFPFLYAVVPISLFPFTAYGSNGLDSVLKHGDYSFSPGLVIGFFLLVWANDTGAYLTGITIGKHKLFERISPKKTWEGFFGGLVLAIAAAWFLSGWLGITGRVEWMLIAVVISVAGTYGDLVESMLKRSSGVKDSGSILPGHGGFLDRFDSTLTAFPLVYLFIALFA